jgi:hypothetical protein
MTNETEKKQFYNEFIQKISNTFIVEETADWWLNKMQEHDALLLRRLEEMKEKTYDDIGCTGLNTDGWCCPKHRDIAKVFKDIKLLITNKEL